MIMTASVRVITSNDSREGPLGKLDRRIERLDIGVIEAWIFRRIKLFSDNHDGKIEMCDETGDENNWG